MPSTLLASRFLLKRFSLQNLSFNSDYKTTLLFCNTILFRKRLLKQGLTTYLTLVFFFFQSSISDLKNVFTIKKHTLENFFTIKNVKLVSSQFSCSSFCFYLLGLDSSTVISASYGLLNKVFRCFSTYTNIFFSAWVSNIYFIGVGYKVFIFNDFLYLRLGFSRMLKIRIPSTVVVLTRKRNHLRILSSHHEYLESFLYVLKNLRIFDCYKGKGIFQTSNFSTVKLKVGKKQQFF